MSVVVKEYHLEVAELLSKINTLGSNQGEVKVHIPSPLPEFEPEKWIVFNHLTPIPETFERTRMRGRGKGKGLIIKRKPLIEVTQLPEGKAENVFNSNEIDKHSVDIPQELQEGFTIHK